MVITFPNMVPFRLSLWDAASSRLSQIFCSWWGVRSHSDGAWRFLLCLLGFPGKDASEGMGRMSATRKQYLWFAGIYAISLLSFAGFTYLLRWLLKVI